jgi:hypothetical protein
LPAFFNRRDAEHCVKREGRREKGEGRREKGEEGSKGNASKFHQFLAS